MKALKRFTIIGIIVVSTAGGLLHFLYSFSGKNPVVGLFSPINESTWEHMKLVFFPMNAYILFFSPKHQEQYGATVPAMLLGTIAATALIPVIFYTYSGILGFNILFADILTFIICVAIGFLIGFRQSDSNLLKKHRFAIYAAALALCLCFFLFTPYPPNIGLFRTP